MINNYIVLPATTLARGSDDTGRRLCFFFLDYNIFRSTASFDRNILIVRHDSIVFVGGSVGGGVDDTTLLLF